ncbi:MAG TPA: VWA-like domain-containing protein [Polyangiales bacterium]
MAPAAPQQQGDLRGWLRAYAEEQSFLDRYPYYAHVLAALAPVADPSVPLMGVSLHGELGRGGRYYLHVNLDELARAPRFLRGLLLHEVHHIVLGHLAHPRFFGVDQPQLMQIAQETSANEFIEEPLPEPILWQHFERFGLRAGQSTLERYQLLCKAKAEGAEPKPQRDTRFVDEHRWSEQQHPPGVGLSETRQILRDAMDQAAQRGEEEAAKIARTRIAGKTPEQLLLSLGGTREAPRVFLDWREALRLFVAHARAPMHTWSRPSRRFPSRVGQVPGRSYQHRTVLRPSLVIAIDTSLSMSEDELAEVARQLRPLSELARLTIVECDVQVVRSYPFRGQIERVEGRGGTDLRPVFQPQLLRSFGADGVVYFTDGEGPYPETGPALPVLWVLTKPGEFGCPWGQRAQLDLGHKPPARAPRKR